MARGRGKANRTDLLAPAGPVAVKSPADQTYGQRTSLENAQRVVPMAPQPTPAPPQQQGGMMGLPPPNPADHVLRPTERPNEPVTAGLPIGPGPGPEALSANQGPARTDPLVQAAAALNAIPKADAPTAALRDAINASLANQATP